MKLGVTFFASIAASAAALWIAGEWGQRAWGGAQPERNREVPGPVVDPAWKPHTLVSSETADKIASAIAEATRPHWGERGIKSERAGALCKDVQFAFACLLAKRFEAYDEMMVGRGAKLGKAAEHVVSLQFESDAYKGEDLTKLRGAPVREQVRFLWEHPGLRQLAIVKVADDQVTCGTGYMLGPHWNRPGYRGIDSLWKARDESEPSLPYLAQEEKIDTAWVEIPVEFGGGVKGLVRLLFGFGERCGKWLPLMMMTTDNPRNPPFPII